MIGKTKRRTALVGSLVLLLTLMATLVAGCGPWATARPEVADQPFTARRESEDGAIVAWSGDTQGSEPGGGAAFGLVIENGTDRSWHGRACLALLGGQSHQLIATLDKRRFDLAPGARLSDTLVIRFPEALDEGAYGLSLTVHRPGGSMVDVVPIQVGATDEVRRETTQQDLDSSLAACPPVEATVDQLVELARADLARRLDIDAEEVAVQGVEPTEFPDASLGVREPGQVYAQVVTPGYVIELRAGDEVYGYHASGERVVAVPTPTPTRTPAAAPTPTADAADKERPPTGDIGIEGVEASAGQVVVRGTSSLDADACIQTELWAGGLPVDWWPAETCVTLAGGTWELVVGLEGAQELEPGVQYMVRAYQAGGPDVVSTYSFDLDESPSEE